MGVFLRGSMLTQELKVQAISAQGTVIIMDPQAIIVDMNMKRKSKQLITV